MIHLTISSSPPWQHRGRILRKKEQNACAPNSTFWWNSRREPKWERDIGEMWMLYMQLNIEKSRCQKSLIKRRVLKGDHPKSENISSQNFGFCVTDVQQLHIIQICVLLTLICEIEWKKRWNILQVLPTWFLFGNILINNNNNNINNIWWYFLGGFYTLPVAQI